MLPSRRNRIQVFTHVCGSIPHAFEDGEYVVASTFEGGEQGGSGAGHERANFILGEAGAQQGGVR